VTVAQPQELIPLETDADGVIRVGGSRVTLETVIAAFDAGATPEDISADFPSLALDDVYAVVTYTLRHRADVDRYLARRREEAEAVRRDVEASPANRRLWERLRARRRS
jgi:uncharacterized protein (DUF433 family)